MLGVLPILPLPAPPSNGDLGPIPLPQVTEQSQDERKETEDQKNASKSQSPPPLVRTHTKTIGIIHPPPDIRNIVDKTALFVAKNGPDFERRIIANNAGNVKFNFLNASDPYHAYYQHRLIIHSPPDIRRIVDKTALFVAKNGPDFERRIIANNAGNVTFNFLNASDPYHAYYQHRLSESSAQNQVLDKGNRTRLN